MALRKATINPANNQGGGGPKAGGGIPTGRGSTATGRAQGVADKSLDAVGTKDFNRSGIARQARLDAKPAKGSGGLKTTTGKPSTPIRKSEAVTAAKGLNQRPNGTTGPRKVPKVGADVRSVNETRIAAEKARTAKTLKVDKTTPRTRSEIERDKGRAKDAAANARQAELDRAIAATRTRGGKSVGKPGLQGPVKTSTPVKPVAANDLEVKIQNAASNPENTSAARKTVYRGDEVYEKPLKDVKAEVSQRRDAQRSDKIQIADSKRNPKGLPNTPVKADGPIPPRPAPRVADPRGEAGRVKYVDEQASKDIKEVNARTRAAAKAAATKAKLSKGK